MTSLRNRRIGDQGRSFGTAAIYAASSNFWTYSHGDYEIDLWAKTFPKEMRAYRKRAKKRGKKLALRNQALKMKPLSYSAPTLARRRQLTCYGSLPIKSVSAAYTRAKRVSVKQRSKER
jgi:hypothetical protein